MGGACVLVLHCGGREFKRWDSPSSVYLFIIVLFLCAGGDVVFGAWKKLGMGIIEGIRISKWISEVNETTEAEA